MTDDEIWAEVFRRFGEMGRDPMKVPMWELWQMRRVVERAV